MAADEMPMASAAVATDPPSSSSARDFFMPDMLARLQEDCKRAYSRVVFNHAYMSTLQDRMAEFLKETGLTTGQVAVMAEVESSAVSQWKSGATLSIGIKPAIFLERKTGYSALWLSQGISPKRVSDTRSAPPKLETALVAVGTALAGVADASHRKTAAEMLSTYLSNPAANADLVPLISKRLLGELPSDYHDSVKKAA